MTKVLRVMIDGIGLSGATTTLEVLGFGDFREWNSVHGRAVRSVVLDGLPIVIDKANQGSRYEGGSLDPKSPGGGSAKSLYGKARQDSLRELDGVLFVADLQAARWEGCKERLEQLTADLHYARRAPDRVPLLFQLNKLDLVPPSAVDEIRDVLRWPGPSDYVPTIATTGLGVHAAFQRLLELVAELR